MPFILFVAFFTIPPIEIYLLIKVGKVIGAGPTILLVVLMAVLGALLLRIEGLGTMRRVQAMVARGELPAREILEGLVLVIAGALMLTPGFFTDVLGLICVLPPVRRRLASGLLRRLLTRGQVTVRPLQGKTIEGEYRRDDGD